MLKDAGIEVESGVCADEAREANIGFLTRMERGTPWVRMKVAASLDGRTALANGQSQWITGPEARRAGHLLRARAQGLLTGVGTVLADDPQMNVRLEGDYPSPVKYVLDAEARTPVTAKILQGKRCVVFVKAGADSARVAALEAAGAVVRPVAATQTTVLDGSIREVLDLKDVLRSIGVDEINELHVEAGAAVNGALISAGLVDEIVAFVAPAFMGEGMSAARLPVFTSMDEVSAGALKASSAWAKTSSSCCGPGRKNKFSWKGAGGPVPL